MYVLWFIAPFFMLGGTFAQGFGLYTIMILTSFILLKEKIINSRLQMFANASLYLIAIFFTFPLLNIIPYFMGTANSYPAKLQSATWLLSVAHKSPISSVFLISSIFLIALGLITKRKDGKKTSRVCIEKLLYAFHIGMLLSTTVLFIYTLYQSLTGFDILAPSRYLGDEKQLLSGNFRVSGFSGHVLSLATISLSLLGFYLTLLIKDFYSLNKRDRILYSLISIEFLWILVLTGSRVAILIGIAMVVYSMFWLFKASKNKTKMYSYATASMILFLILLYFAGFFVRMNEFLQLLTESRIDRIYFWQVHWRMFLDSPLFGQGYSLIKTFIREQYYNSLGFEEFGKKYNAHNIFLETLASIGFIGSTLLIYFIKKWWTYLSEAVINSKVSKKYLIAFGVACLANLIHGVTQNTFFDSNLTYALFYLFWIVIWICCIKPERSPSNIQSRSQNLA